MHGGRKGHRHLLEAALRTQAGNLRTESEGGNLANRVEPDFFFQCCSAREVAI